MSGKKLLLKYEDLQEYGKIKGEPLMDIGEYFQTIQYILMGSVFISLLLIFLYAYYGKEEETENE
jgi:hypothetical protein